MCGYSTGLVTEAKPQIKPKEDMEKRLNYLQVAAPYIQQTRKKNQFQLSPCACQPE